MLNLPAANPVLFHCLTPPPRLPEALQWPLPLFLEKLEKYRTDMQGQISSAVQKAGNDIIATLQPAITGKVDRSFLFDNPTTSPKIKPSLLPSYVDDVLEYANLAGFPGQGESGKIYVARDTGRTYRWPENGSAYVEIAASPVSSVNGRTGAVVLTAADLGAYEKPAGGIPLSDLDLPSLKTGDPANAVGGRHFVFKALDVANRTMTVEGTGLGIETGWVASARGQDVAGADDFGVEEHFGMFGAVTAVAESGGDTVVTFDRLWPDAAFVAGSVHLLWFPDHPSAGTADETEYMHAEGEGTAATMLGAHAEGRHARAVGRYSHAEGYGTGSGVYTYAAGYGSHAEGHDTVARGVGSHAEGLRSETGVKAHVAHAEGIAFQRYAGSGASAHYEFYPTKALGDGAHAEGSAAEAHGYASHAEGYFTRATGKYAHAEGKGGEPDSAAYAEAAGNFSHTEGNCCRTTGGGAYGHAEGEGTTVSGESAHAEGKGCSATDAYAHAEGLNTTASGPQAHAEGQSTEASGNDAHAEGLSTRATGSHSHAEGYLSEANAHISHAEGFRARTRIDGNRTTDRNAFVWNGDEDGAFWTGKSKSTDFYNAHGRGTYNINPRWADAAVKWLPNLYIGEDDFRAALKFAVQNMSAEQKADVAAALGVADPRYSIVTPTPDASGKVVLQDRASNVITPVVTQREVWVWSGAPNGFVPPNGDPVFDEEGGSWNYGTSFLDGNIEFNGYFNSEDPTLTQLSWDWYKMSDLTATITAITYLDGNGDEVSSISDAARIRIEVAVNGTDIGYVDFYKRDNEHWEVDGSNINYNGNSDWWHLSYVTDAEFLENYQVNGSMYFSGSLNGTLTATKTTVYDSTVSTIQFPTATPGKMRDFIVEVDLSAAPAVPNINWVAPTGETVGYRTADGSFPILEKAINELSFTENKAGKSLVSHKVVKEVP